MKTFAFASFKASEESSSSSQVLLQQVERFATYVGDAIVNENIDTGNRTDILLQRKNIGKTLAREFFRL